MSLRMMWGLESERAGLHSPLEVSMNSQDFAREIDMDSLS
jgi:hypothetical protein